MKYLAGVIPGAIAGIAIALSASISMKISNEVRWMKGEIKIYPIILFFIFTFLFGPALSFMYSLKFKTEGVDALWEYSLFNTLNLLLFLVICYFMNKKWGKYISKGKGYWINKEIWKESLISFLIIIFALFWLLPLIFNRIIAGTFI